MPVIIGKNKKEDDQKPKNWDTGRVIRANEVYAREERKVAVAGVGADSQTVAIKPAVCLTDSKSESQLTLPGTDTEKGALKLTTPHGFYLDQNGEPMGKCVAILLLKHSPSVNHAYLLGKNKATGKPIRYRSPDYKAWISECHQAITGGGIRKATDVTFPIPLDQGVKLTILANFPLTGNTKHDIDNINKAVFDVMNGTIYEDDEQVMEFRAFKSFSKHPSIRVSVEIPEEYRGWKPK